MTDNSLGVRSTIVLPYGENRFALSMCALDLGASSGHFGERHLNRTDSADLGDVRASRGEGHDVGLSGLWVTGHQPMLLPPLT